MRLLSLFSGVGAPEMALRNLSIDYELVGFSEIDEHAIKSYCEIHKVNKDLNLGDITEIEIVKLPCIDLITHGSPCQDFSVAGYGKGGDLGSGTRSSLMWNTVEIVKHCKPKYVLWENVPNVVSKKHKLTFDKYIKTLEELGYTNYFEKLNAKDYGVPQNRNRIFVISILGNEEFKFPKKINLDKKLKDILEESVDEKYYISKKIQDRLTLFPKGRFNGSYKVIGTTALHPYNKEGNLIFDKSTRCWVYSDDTEVMSTISATEYKQPKQILIKTNTKRGYDVASVGDGIRLDHINSKTGRGRIQKQISSTLTCTCQLGVIENV